VPPAQTASNVNAIERRLVVRAGKAFVSTFTSNFHELHLLTPCPLPAKGPAILVCNHTSSLDPVLLQAAAPRVITWMMAKEYMNIPGLRAFLRAIEPIPVERSGRDLAATRGALRALKDGKILGIFPEGRIETAPKLLDFQTGVALLAKKSGVPVYPAYLEGSLRGKGMMEAFFFPNRVTLAFGPPVQITDDESLEDATARIRAAVEALMPLHP